MKALGRPLFNRLISMEDNTLMKQGAMLINLQKSYNEKYTETIDPVIHLISYITDIKRNFKMKDELEEYWENQIENYKKNIIDTPSAVLDSNSDPLIL
jgi:hypothetical protein